MCKYQRVITVNHDKHKYTEYNIYTDAWTDIIRVQTGPPEQIYKVYAMTVITYYHVVSVENASYGNGIQSSHTIQ